jgi:hypothetical protein
VRSFADIYPFLAPGELIAGARNADYAAAWDKAQAGSFAARTAAPPSGGAGRLARHAAIPA